MSPHQVTSSAVGGEVAFHQVRDPMRRIRDGGHGPLLGGMANNVVDPHQTLDPFVVHHPAPVDAARR